MQRGCFPEKGWSWFPSAVFGVACVQISWGALVMLREPGKGIFLAFPKGTEPLLASPLEQIQPGVSQGPGTLITMALEDSQKSKEQTYWSPPKITAHTGSALEVGLREYQDPVGWTSQGSLPERGGPQVPSPCRWLFICCFTRRVPEASGNYSQSLRYREDFTKHQISVAVLEARSGFF